MPGEATQRKHRVATERPGKPLIVRAGAARTFGSLGSFLAIIFLGAGIYLLEEVLTDPLRAQSFGLISGAFIIALATILIYFIFTPRTKSRSSKARRRIHTHPAVQSLVVAAPTIASCEEPGKDLAMHA